MNLGYKSVQTGNLSVKINGDIDLEALCTTPRLGGMACKYVFKGSANPAANDGTCCPTSYVFGVAP